jgi:DNA-directed RNA polymerase subunit RPC12/RpoP
MYMERTKYICGGCGKVIISEKPPAEWKKRNEPERYICEQCDSEMELTLVVISA